MKEIYTKPLERIPFTANSGNLDKFYQLCKLLFDKASKKI